jgi:hypothetical protein
MGLVVQDDTGTQFADAAGAFTDECADGGKGGAFRTGRWVTGSEGRIVGLEREGVVAD